jgi:hypothetical protein
VNERLLAVFDNLNRKEFHGWLNSFVLLRITIFTARADMNTVLSTSIMIIHARSVMA